MANKKEITLTCQFAGISASMTGPADDPIALARDLTAAIRTIQGSDDACRLMAARQIANQGIAMRADHVRHADMMAARAAMPTPPAEPELEPDPELDRDPDPEPAGE